jgi:hypothetical protein
VWLEITVRNQVPNGNIFAGTLFIRAISRETLENLIFEN